MKLLNALWPSLLAPSLTLTQAAAQNSHSEFTSSRQALRNCQHFTTQIMSRNLRPGNKAFYFSVLARWRIGS
jgi:hypothetical protein